MELLAPLGKMGSAHPGLIYFLHAQVSFLKTSYACGALWEHSYQNYKRKYQLEHTAYLKKEKMSVQFPVASVAPPTGFRAPDKFCTLFWL